MTGDDFLKVASELVAPFLTGKQVAKEALFRTIISRSYYGAYHLAIAYLASLGLPSSSDHGLAKRWLVEAGEPNARRAGRLLEDLYSARQRADYRLGDPKAISNAQSVEFVRDQIEQASYLKSLLEKCSVEPARSAVKDGIERFRKRSAR